MCAGTAQRVILTYQERHDDEKRQRHHATYRLRKASASKRFEKVKCMGVQIHKSLVFGVRDDSLTLDVLLSPHSKQTMRC